nr:cag pathogenicity island protein [Helicobacter pylori]
MPHIATMGRDEILQQTPLKTPLDRTRYARQSFRPINDHSSISLSLFDENRAI